MATTRQTRPRRRPPPPRSLVCVASLQPQKGQRHLVEACRLLRDRGRAVRCTLVGEGEERPALEAQIRALGLEDVVSLLGAQPRDRVVAIVEAADVVVQPSVVLPSGKTEGIPVALMEALAAERAVVASEVSGIPELVVDGITGLLVAPGDAAALADASNGSWTTRHCAPASDRPAGRRCSTSSISTGTRRRSPTGSGRSVAGPAARAG